MSQPIRISPHLWQVGGAELSAPGDAAVYLMLFEGGAALVDAGCGPGHENITAAIETALPPGTPLTHLFLTHCHYDHCGGAQWLRQQYGCRIVVHMKDAPFLAEGNDRVTAAEWYGASLSPLVADHLVADDQERFAVGDGRVTALFCPGHSPGSLVYLAMIDGQRVLFGQDVHGPLHPALLSCRSDYLASLDRMLALDADILCEGHFGIIRGAREVRDFILQYRRTAS